MAGWFWNACPRQVSGCSIATGGTRACSAKGWSCKRTCGLVSRRFVLRASQMSASRQEVAAASAALKLVKLRNREGRVLLLEVLDAERVATQARIGLVEAICAHNRAQFGLHRLVGGPEQVDKR